MHSANSGFKYDVSVIIPAYNRAELTRKCLESIANADTRCTYEVIIVDNHSTDETPALLADITGDIKVLTEKNNLGFAVACNRGARLADGAYILFLNNDTEVSDRWLDEMVSALESHPNAGIVGARLLYPDGRVQHAGVAINPEGIPYHIFQNFDANHPAVIESRSMKAVTAACMLIKKSMFEELGGFDETYKNGFEDIDLCLRARAQGLDIWYCGSTTITHREESSEGRKDFDSQNLTRLRSRWQNELTVDEESYLTRFGMRINWTSTGGRYESTSVNTQSSTRAEAESAQPDLLDLAQKQYVDGDYTAAAETLQKAVSSRMTLGRDDSFEMWQLLGNSLTRLNRAIDAERAFLKAAEENNNSERPFLGLGSVAILEKNWRAGEYGFLAALTKNPTVMRAEFGLGICLAEQNRHEEALKHFIRVSEEEPLNSEAVFYLYRSALECAKPEYAIAALSTYLKAYPEDADFLFHLAGAQWKSGSLDEAAETCRAVLQLKPDHKGAKDALNHMLSRIGVHA